MDKTISFSLSISSSNGLGLITFGDQIFSANENGAYGNPGGTPQIGTVKKNSGWIPMFFSGPGKFIWLNLDAPNCDASDLEAGVVGADCFTTGNGSPVTITLAMGADDIICISFDGNRNQILWDKGMQSPPVPKYVPLSVAIKGTSNWRNFWHLNGIFDSKNAMYISIIDIDRVINPPGKALDGQSVNGIRLYFALRDANPGTADFPNSAHFYVVAVNDQGEDILLPSANTLVYDTTMPCPPMCGSGNVINPYCPCDPAFNTAAVDSILNGDGCFADEAALQIPNGMLPGRNPSITLSIMALFNDNEQNSWVSVWQYPPPLPAHELKPNRTNLELIDESFSLAELSIPVLRSTGSIDEEQPTIIGGVTGIDTNFLRKGQYIVIYNAENSEFLFRCVVLSFDSSSGELTLDSNPKSDTGNIYFYIGPLFLQASYDTVLENPLTSSKNGAPVTAPVVLVTNVLFPGVAGQP